MKNKFTLEFEEKFLNELRNFIGEITIFEPAEELQGNVFLENCSFNASIDRKKFSYIL